MPPRKPSATTSPIKSKIIDHSFTQLILYKGSSDRMSLKIRQLSIFSTTKGSEEYFCYGFE